MPAPIIPAPSTPTLVGLERLDALGPQLAGVDRLQVEEERLDHVLRVLADDQLGQVARLDPRRGVEVDLRALDRGRQDRPLGGVDRALGLLAQQRRERRQERRQRWGARACRRASCSRRGPTGSAASRRRGWPGSTPWRPGPAPRGWRRARRRGPSPWRVGRLEAGALEQHVHQRRLDAEHPDDAGDAAAAGQQAEGGLGQADLDLGVVDDDPVVAGQGDLEAAAERGAVDRGDDRPREASRAGAGRP